MLLPIPLLITLLLGLISLAIPIGGLFALYSAWRNYRSLPRYVDWPRRENPPREHAAAEPEAGAATVSTPPRSPFAQAAVLAPLIAGVLLLLAACFGRLLVESAYPSWGDNDPRPLHSDRTQELVRPDGTKIHAEIFGPADAPALVFTHGWSTSNTEWYYAKRQLGGSFRLIFWDLPGLGQSTQPDNRDFSLEKMASDLDAVVSLAGGKPVILVGHSIGGMINLTYCRLFPGRLGHQVSGIVQVDTSYTNPVNTTKGAALSRALQKPVAEPILHAMIWFSPVVRAMNWFSYRNGTSQLMNAKSGFAGSETRGQVDLISRYGWESSPAVVARGTLAMFHWDATPVLPAIHVPVLLLVGRQDTTTLPGASEYMQRTIPGARLEEVEPSAHYGLLEQNQRFDAAIARFAQALPRAPAAASLDKVSH